MRRTNSVNEEKNHIKILVGTDHSDDTCTTNIKIQNISTFINPFRTKLYLSDLNIQFVPRSKHSLPLL